MVLAPEFGIPCYLWYSLTGMRRSWRPEKLHPTELTDSSVPEPATVKTIISNIPSQISLNKDQHEVPQDTSPGAPWPQVSSKLPPVDTEHTGTACY